MPRRRVYSSRAISAISAIVTLNGILTVHLLVGDFNLLDLCWRTTSEDYAAPEPSESSSSSFAFIDGMSMLNLKQLNVARNNLDRTIDLLFLNEDNVPMCE